MDYEYELHVCDETCDSIDIEINEVLCEPMDFNYYVTSTVDDCLEQIPTQTNQGSGEDDLE